MKEKTIKAQNETPRIVLTFQSGESKELRDYQLVFIPRKGDILQWNGIRYAINEVIFHQKEGFSPYIELKSIKEE